MVVDSLVTTDVDSLVELLQKHKKLSLEAAAKKLHVSESILQTWVDFLLEEGIVGLEYNFVTPYVYLQKTKDHFELETKDEFFARMRSKEHNPEKLQAMWKSHVKDHEQDIRNAFFDKAQKRGVQYDRIEEYFRQYMESLLQ